MTQITQEQREHWEAVGARTTAKLQAFHKELTADERALLSLGLWQAMAEAAGADEGVAGFAVRIEGRGPASVVWGFLGDVGKAILLEVAVSGVKAGASAVVDSVGSQLPSDATPGTSPVFPGRRGP